MHVGKRCRRARWVGAYAPGCTAMLQLHSLRQGPSDAGGSIASPQHVVKLSVATVVMLRPRSPVCCSVYYSAFMGVITQWMRQNSSSILRFPPGRLEQRGPNLPGGEGQRGPPELLAAKDSSKCQGRCWREAVGALILVVQATVRPRCKQPECRARRTSSHFPRRSHPSRQAASTQLCPRLCTKFGQTSSAVSSPGRKRAPGTLAKLRAFAQIPTAFYPSITFLVCWTPHSRVLASCTSVLKLS